MLACGPACAALAAAPAPPSPVASSAPPATSTGEDAVGPVPPNDGVTFDTVGLDPLQARASRRLVEATLARLPPRMRAALARRGVRIAWRDDLPERAHGRAAGARIALRRDLLAGWMRRMGAGDPAGPEARPAVAALLHELAHVYDRGGGRLSSDPRLLDLAGWPVRPLRLGLRASRNDFRDRSPDPYELASPAEFVAVNLEHFLLDPEYGCRRPALHRHFAAAFGWSPPVADCAPGQALVAADGDTGGAALLELDPARVYAVDYLFAEGNDRPMSRWGHAMLRLVVCAPGRAPGPDCRLDLQHHRVLSFRAFVDDVQVSSWRGLTGRYPSRLFVLPLGQVVDEYTQAELRALRSIPLRLHPGEVAALLERAAQVQWSYDGRYYFVSNNCAVETWKLLHDGVPRLGALRLRSITPDGLLRRLARAGVADTSVLRDREAAVRDGYRFESQAAYFERMYAVAAGGRALPARDAGAWMALAPERRRPWLHEAGLKQAAALLLLEQAAARRERLQARDALKRRLLRGDGAVGEVAGRLRAWLHDAAWTGRPASLLPEGGYGLPQAAERGRLGPRIAAGAGGQQAARGRLEQDAQALLPPADRQRLQAIDRNLEIVGGRLRALAAPAGG